MSSALSYFIPVFLHCLSFVLEFLLLIHSSGSRWVEPLFYILTNIFICSYFTLGNGKFIYYLPISPKSIFRHLYFYITYSLNLGGICFLFQEFLLFFGFSHTFWFYCCYLVAESLLSHI